MDSDKKQKFIKELAQKIRTAEGTTDERAAKEGYESGYDVTLGYGAYDGDSDKPVSSMTLSELKDFQQQMINRSEGKIEGTTFGSSAAGAYQFTKSTLFGGNVKDEKTGKVKFVPGLVQKLKIPMDQKFNPEMQDKLYEALLEEDKVVSKLQQGKPKAAQKKVAGRWASLTDFSGTPAYEQNRSPSAKAQDKEVKDLFYNTAEGFILNKEEPMATKEEDKNKQNEKPSLLGPLRQESPKVADKEIDAVMEDVIPKDNPQAAKEMQTNLLIEGDKEQTTSGAPVSPSMTLRNQIGTDLQQQKEEAKKQQQIQQQQQQQMGNRQPASKEAQIEQQRSQLSQSMQDALSYFGPRMVSLIFGGASAMEATDRVLTGFDQYTGRKRAEQRDIEETQYQRQLDKQKMDLKNQPQGMSPYQQEQIRLKEAEFQARHGYKPGEQAQQAAVKLSEEQNQMLDKIDSSIRTMDEVMPKLKKGGVTGWLSGVLGRPFSKMVGSEEESTRLALEKLRVDDALIRIGQTKGAISDKEMDLFLAPTPKLSDDEKIWETWINDRRQAQKAISDRIRTGKRVDNPARDDQFESLKTRQKEADDNLINKYL